MNVLALLDLKTIKICQMFFYYPSLFPSPTVNFSAHISLSLKSAFWGDRMKQGYAEIETQYNFVCVRHYLL